MALVHWKQIDGDLSGSRVLTGSLVVSGTISADEFIGIDPSAIFTGSISASVSPSGNVFTIKSGSSDLVTVDENGNVVVEGTLTAQEFYTEIVSASVIFESGSTLFGNSLDDTHQITGSLLISGADGHQISGSLTVSTTESGSTAIVSNNTTVGYPTSNEWQDSLDGSYFDIFNHSTHISEILRFMAGVMSSSLDVAAPTPNTKTWGSTTANYNVGSTVSRSQILTGVFNGEDVKLSNNWRTSAYIDSTKTGSFETIQEYFINKEFLLNSETGSEHAGTNPLRYSEFSRVPAQVLTEGTFNTLTGTLSANATGTTLASSNASYFGLGLLTSGQSTNVKVKVETTQSFKDNYSSTTPFLGSSVATFSTSSFSILNNDQFSTNNGITVSKIETTQPAVIPAAYQDGDFTMTTAVTGRKYTGGATAANSISASGYYRLDSTVIGLQTGSQVGYTTQTPTDSTTSFYLYHDGPSDIRIGTQYMSASADLVRNSITATSRSLSGAPYLLDVDYTFTFSGEVSGAFDPGYGTGGNPLYVSTPINNWNNIGATSLSNVYLGVATNGNIQHNTSTLGVLSADKNTQRSIGEVPSIDDIGFISSSYSFNLNSNVDNTQLTQNQQQALNYNLNFNLRANHGSKYSTTLNETSATQLFYDNTLFGQSKTTLMAIYSRAQGYDASSLTGTSENFSGEDHRIKVNNNVLTFAGESFTTNTYDITNVLGNLDLQVKPGYLVDPGGSYRYWYDSGFGTATYKYYIRKFRISGAKTSMTVNVEKTLNNWDSSSNGYAAVILFKSSGDSSGISNSLSTARIYDPSELNSNSIETGITSDNFKNPFSDNLDLYGNIGGTVSSTTYTMPLRNADGMYLDNDDNEFYLIIRYKGDPSPITDINITTS
tara:strand:+ start:4523 stop:7183 length:2661 start_codon:yes stop_codon:yes gene_type:complete